MNSKRKDSKNRVLREGEMQRKDGQYAYRYTDLFGKRQIVYSWRLNASDPQPSGKRSCRPLRELEQQIKADIIDGIATTDASRITVDDLFKYYCMIRTDLRDSTRSQYIGQYQRHIKPRFGPMPVANIDKTMLRAFYAEKAKNENKKLNSLLAINAILTDLFEIGVEKRVIRYNPARDALRQSGSKTHAPKALVRHALTAEQQILLITYLKSSGHYAKYYPLVLFLLATGARIGEALALQWDDIDFTNNIIHIRHNLCHFSENGVYKFKMGPTKTGAGERDIPIVAELRYVLEAYPRLECRFKVDDFHNFVFSMNGSKPISAKYMTTVLKNIREEFNKLETEKADREKRVAVLLPYFTPHTFRHSFCTRLCEQQANGEQIDLKLIQQVMGHSSFQVTMDIYNEVVDSRVKQTFSRLNGKLSLS